MSQLPAVAFTAFTAEWPRATSNGDRHRPMRHWCGKEFAFFWQRSMCNALTAKEGFPMLKQSFSAVLLKESAVFQQGGTA